MTERPPLGVIILAAGRGIRMNSFIPKVLHSVGGRPMLLHVLETARSLQPEKIVVIAGDDHKKVKSVLEDEDVIMVHQKQRLGTGHAVLQAREEFDGFEGCLLVLSGDVPLLSQMSLDKLLARHYVSDAAATVLTTIFDNPTGYGRVIRNGQANLGRIVEEKDCSDELRTIKEINAGVYVFDAELLLKYLPEVKNDNAQQEYYLPDVLPILISSGRRVAIDRMSDSREFAGVNTREQLVEANRIYRELYEKN